MLYTVLPTIALIFSLLAFFLSVYAVLFLKKRNARSVSLKRMAKLEADMLDLVGGQESVISSMRKLRSRVGMREKRAAGKMPNGEDIPDPQTDPENWKRYARLKYLNQKR